MQSAIRKSDGMLAEPPSRILIEIKGNQGAIGCLSRPLPPPQANIRTGAPPSHMVTATGWVELEVSHLEIAPCDPGRIHKALRSPPGVRHLPTLVMTRRG
jgi:hypothetical protein